MENGLMKFKMEGYVKSESSKAQALGKLGQVGPISQD